MGLIDWFVNALILIGLGLVVYGLWIIFPPVGIVAAGVALMLVAVAIVRMNELSKRTIR